MKHAVANPEPGPIGAFTEAVRRFGCRESNNWFGPLVGTMGKSMIIYLVWDTSGSMAEWGKKLIARGIARAMEQYLRLGYGPGRGDLKLVTWGNDTRVFDWDPDQEFPPEMLVCNGEANAKALITLLAKQPEGKVLLLTDGFWSGSDAKELRRWEQGLQPGTLRIILIGGDANPQLKSKNVFAAEDLFLALDDWLAGGVA